MAFGFEAKDSIFALGGSFDDYLLQFTASAPEVGTTGVGTKCELAEYDCLYNSQGHQITLLSGTTQAPANGDGLNGTESAISRTTYWDDKGSKSHVNTEIRSPYMKAALTAVIPLYKDRNTTFTHIAFVDKPQHVFHFRDELFEYGRGLEHGSEGQQHISLLIEHLQQELADAISAYTINVEFANKPSIDFRHYWTIFKPNDLIYLTGRGISGGDELVVLQKSLLISCTCKEDSHQFSHFWTLNYSYIDFIGEDPGYAERSVNISYYQGWCEVAELPALPLRLHPQKSDIKEKLVSRGKKFISLKGSNHRHFKGVAQLLWQGEAGHNPSRLFEPSRGTFTSISVDGRVMIDSKPFESNYFFDEDGTITTASLTEEQYLMCRGHVQGLSLGDGKWGLFPVDGIGPVDYDVDVFLSSLMLEPRYKNILLSLVRMQSPGAKHAFEDIIKGKGKGVVFLLHGEPGTGKTMTAESIADCCKKPLLRIDTNALSNSSSLETNLGGILRLAERWGAIALLDEADIFLEQRSQNFRRRNSLVTVFLRVLEYYRGVLFLTTNRINSLDRAFKSRIQVSIHYPPLNSASRRELWQIFLSKASPPERNKDQWAEVSKMLACEDLNGRQIRDVVRTAQASALGQEEMINMQHLHDALDSLKMFETEFEKGRTKSRSRSLRANKRRRISYDNEGSDYSSDEIYFH